MERTSLKSVAPWGWVAGWMVLLALLVSPAALADVNKPDLFLMGVAALDGADYIVYWRGNDLDTGGTVQDNWYNDLGNSVGNNNQGGGSAVGFINDNDYPDTVLMTVDDPDGSNHFRYMVLWDIRPDTGFGGTTKTSTIQVDNPALGSQNDGGGVALGYINDNDTLDLVFMGVNDSSPDTFRYAFGWDIGSDGRASSWSSIKTSGPPALGNDADGGGVALGYINDNDRPDLIFMGVDDASGANHFRYAIGWDLDTSGNVQSWTSIRKVGGLGHYNSGGGACLSYLDDNGRPDLVLMGIDNPDNGTSRWYKVGWNLDENGNPTSWSSMKTVRQDNSEFTGGGIDVLDIRQPQVTLSSPQKGSNNKVNVVLNGEGEFTAELSGRVAKADWIVVSGGTVKKRETTTTDTFRYTFTQTGDYTVRCRVTEKIGDRKRELPWVQIDAKVWERPVMASSPPDGSDASWYGDGNYYVGVAGSLVRLEATTSDTKGNQIEKYIWDFNKDNHFDENDVIQPAGQSISYVWDPSVADGRISCVAESNYSIRSEPREFKYKVYDNLEVEAGEGYAGKPNDKVRLEGQLTNRDSFSGTNVFYQWRVNSKTAMAKTGNSELKDTGTAKEDASVKTDYIELTPNVNHKSGQYEYQDLQVGERWSVSGEFWTGGGTGADEFRIYPWAGQYKVMFDEYHDLVELYRDDTLLHTLTQTDLDNSRWRPFRVAFDEGHIQVYLDHHPIIDVTDDGFEMRQSSSNYNTFTFSAWTGGMNNYHRVRNLQWTNGEPIDTDANGVSRYDGWDRDGLYEVMFTVTVKTKEGLVLEASDMGKVNIESGRPTSQPGGPYRAGIDGGNFSPAQFEGNFPDYVESDDIGHVDDWLWFFGDPYYNEHGLITEIYEYPSSYDGEALDDLNKIEDYIEKKMPLKAVKLFPNLDCPGSDGELKHRDGVSVVFSDWFYLLHRAFLDVPEAGEYTFYPKYYDGFRLKIDGQVVAEDIYRGDVEEKTVTHTFDAPGRYPIEFAYFASTGRAGFIMRWTPPGGTKQIIPPEQFFSGKFSQGTWNPTHAYSKEGRYSARLKVHSEHGKWSTEQKAQVTVIDGRIAGIVRASDRRTPVPDVKLTLKSPHVDVDVLKRIAEEDSNLNVTTDGDGIYTYTAGDGEYSFENIPLGGYRVYAHKQNGDTHEFEKSPLVTELDLSTSNRPAIDFVDLSVFSVRGSIVYDIQLGGKDIYVKEVVIKAQAIGSTNTLESLPSLAASENGRGNYKLPLFTGKYLFKPELRGHDIQINEDVSDYDPDTGLVTIDRSRDDIHFTDSTKYVLTVFTTDSGDHPISTYPSNFSNEGDPLVVTASRDEGSTDGEIVEYYEDGELSKTKVEFELPPGEYTIKIQGAEPETQEVTLDGEDAEVTMNIPVQIDLEFVTPDGEGTYKPKLFVGEEGQRFLELFGLTEDDNPVGYMYYYKPEPQEHTYTVKATANGHPVLGYQLIVTDNVSMITNDEAEEQQIPVNTEPDDEEDDEQMAARGKYDYTVVGGLPKPTSDDPPLASPKTITFHAEAEGYEDSEPISDDVTVLGQIQKGDESKIVAIPSMNYSVLHDPPGDGSYSYFEDTARIKGMISNMQIRVPADWDWSRLSMDYPSIPVYPAPWSDNREYLPGDLEKVRLLDDQDPKNMQGYFVAGALIEAYKGGLSLLVGPYAYLVRLAGVGITMAKIATGASVVPGIHFLQYQVTPTRRIQTPVGDTLPDQLGPGKGDVYFGEGWTLALQEKYFLGIVWNEGTQSWDLDTRAEMTYDLLNRHNQYTYTAREIEDIITDLDQAIADADDSTPEGQEEKNRLTSSRDSWQKYLNRNLAYKWRKNLEKPTDERQSFEEFRQAENLSGDHETLIFNAGPAFEYSRSILNSDVSSYSVNTSVGTNSSMAMGQVQEVGPTTFGGKVVISYQTGAQVSISSGHTLGRSWQSGQEIEQKVGFVLQDNDIGDSISTYVYTDPVWSTPIFFQDPGSVTSDPWENGTNRAVDFTLELLQGPTDKFDYGGAGHYELKFTYDGQRELEASSVAFQLFASPAANTDNLTFRFNGDPGPFNVYLSQRSKTATVVVSVYPPEEDKDNPDEKTYPVVIGAIESADAQIYREIRRDVTFADQRAPRGIVVIPYDGERISPEFFPSDDPFKIQVVTHDTDLKKMQLEVRSKRPDGTWDAWSVLDSLVWQEGGTNENVTLFKYAEREPAYWEYTFKWNDTSISNLGVGEYALRAVAIDKATRSDNPGFEGNVDLNPPQIVFQVDSAKPSVLTTLPDYQSKESERIYRGELSAIFTDDMRPHDFTSSTFKVVDLLKGAQTVSGFVSYSPTLRKAIFVPDEAFRPNGHYRTTIKTDVRDLAGNPLDNEFSWTWRTTDAPFEENWSIALRATDGTSNDANNIASVEYAVADGEDEHDARAVPSLASQMRLSFVNRAIVDGMGDPIELERDARPADGRLEHHWFCVVNNAPEGADVSIYYTPSTKLRRSKTTRQYQNLYLVEFDRDGRVANRIELEPSDAPVDEDTGEIGEVHAYTYTNSATRDDGGTTYNFDIASRYFRLDVQKVSLVATSLESGSSGWQFLSVPITPQRDDPFVNLGDDIDPFQLYTYDTELAGYRIYPLDLGYVSLMEGHGYFTRFEGSTEIDVGGSSNHDNVELALDEIGWHAIGNPFVLDVNVADLSFSDGTTSKSFDQAASDGWVNGILYRWVTGDSDAYGEVTTPTQDAGATATALEPWDGAWLRTSVANLTLTIPAPPGVADADSPLPASYTPPMAPGIEDSKLQIADLREGGFRLPLQLRSAFASDVTTQLGTHALAQVGHDSFDQSEPPTLGQTVSLYFDHSDWDESPDLYNRDYQPTLQPGESRTWQLTAFSDKPRTEMTLSWEDAIANVPRDVMLWIRDASEGSTFNVERSDVPSGEDQPANPRTRQHVNDLDMRQTTSLNITSESRITRVPLEIRAERFVLTPPQDVQVVAGEKQVTVQWRADDNPFIGSYSIFRDGSVIAQLNVGTLNVERSNGGQVTFIDTEVEEEATYTYKVTLHYVTGAELSSEPMTVTVLPFIEKTALLPSYPNPFNPETWIPYELEREADVHIDIYDVRGQLVRRLDIGTQPRGRYTSPAKAAHWDGRTQMGERAASGIYFVLLKAGHFTAVRKMVIVK